VFSATPEHEKIFSENAVYMYSYVLVCMYVWMDGWIDGWLCISLVPQRFEGVFSHSISISLSVIGQVIGECERSKLQKTGPSRWAPRSSKATFSKTTARDLMKV
jgi:hypothetical protein